MSLPSSETTNILHIIGSPKTDASTSTRIAEAFLEGCLAHDSEQHERPAKREKRVTTLDVWDADLPPFDRELAIAKLAPIVGEERSAAQIAAWARVETVIEDFARFDKIVLSTPMWNFSLPYRLKHYIDLLVQPGITFGVDSEMQHVGLLKDRPLQLVLTRSSPLPEGSPEDFLLPYLKHVCSFIGLRDVRALVIEGTTLPAEAREKFIAEQCERARVAGASF
jgi:FMN-dependent NADH-azoreductase